MPGEPSSRVTLMKPSTSPSDSASSLKGQTLKENSVTEKRNDILQTQSAFQPPDDGVAEPRVLSRRKPLSFHLAFLSLAVMTLIVAMDSTSLAIATPTIINQLHGTTLEGFWASISFMLSVVVTQPLYTSVSDVLGRKIPLYASIFLFAVGSVVFAVADCMGLVILGRVLQGLGGGGLDVLQEVILTDMTNLKERPLYLGLITVPLAIGTILGPITGALFSEYVSWRWIGWINLPIIAAGFVLAFFFLHLRPIDDTCRGKLRRLDWAGILLFAVGSTAIAFPLSWADAIYPWSSWKTITPLAVGVLVLAIFAAYEQRPPEPVFPRRIFTNRTAVATLVGGAINGMTMYSLLFYLPLFYQAVCLAAPLESGLLLLSGSISVVAAGGLSAAAVTYTRHYRWLVSLAWILTAAGTGLLVLLEGASSRPQMVLFAILSGAGIGSLLMTLAIPMQASAATDDAGLAVGILVAFRLFGALLGLSIGASAFNVAFAREVAALVPLPGAFAVLEDASQAIGFITALRGLEEVDSDVLGSVIEAYRKGFQVVWVIMAGFAGLGFVASLFTKELSLEKEDMGRQRFEPPG